MTQRTIGRYEVKAELGKGGMATVFLAHDPAIGREVAVKVLPRQMLHDPSFRERFEREAHTIAMLEHPAIVPIYDFGDDEGQPYLVMRYMKGGSLADRLKRGPMSISQAVGVLERIGVALDVAHRNGVIHRDLKPANILFDEYDKAFLADFGIVKLTQETATLTGTAIIGTPAYMSPEQAYGQSDIDARSDVYSLGAILFEMLTGQTPFHADTPVKLMMAHVMDPVPRVVEVNPNLPAGCNAIIGKAMAKERQDRYSMASQMTQALHDTARGKPVQPVVAGASTAVATQATVFDTAPKSPAAPTMGAPPHSVGTAKALSGGRANKAALGAAGGVAVLLICCLGLFIVYTQFINPDGSIVPALIAQNPTDTLPPPSIPAPPTIDTVDPVNTESVEPTQLGDDQSSATSPSEPSPATATPSPESPDPPTLTSPPPTPLRATPTTAPEPDPPTPIQALSAEYNGQDGLLMRLVPEGEFIMGSSRSQVEDAMDLCQLGRDNDPCGFNEFSNEMPQHIVFVPDFYMDVTEITNGQYKDCVNSGACNLPEAGTGRYSRQDYYEDLRFTNYPVVWVTWFDARDYCAWVGERLPTEAEWEKAARGEDGLIFPWGDTFDGQKANTEELGGNQLKQVGSYPEGASPYEILDLAGSVWEWVADWYGADYFDETPEFNPRGPSSGVERILRGGSYGNFQHYARATNRGARPPDSSTSFRGFRCVVDAVEVAP